MAFLTFDPFINTQIIVAKSYNGNPEIYDNEPFQKLKININLDIKFLKDGGIDDFLSDCKHSKGESVVQVYYLSNYHFSEICSPSLQDLFLNVLLYNYGKHFIFCTMQKAGFDVSSTNTTSVSKETLIALSQLYVNIILREGNFIAEKKRFNEFLGMFNQNIHPSIEGFEKHDFSLAQLLEMIKDMKSLQYGGTSRVMISNTNTFQNFYNSGGFSSCKLLLPFLTQEFIDQHPEGITISEFNL